MKAIGYYESLPVEDDKSLIEVDIDKPVPSGRDLLVRIDAVSVNPVDTKVRMRKAAEDDTPVILGWDAVGEVVECGGQASMFKPGDKVWYAGAINRQGSNAQYHLVDERIVSLKPASISDAEAAAMPLTSLTAYEMLFDRLRVNDPVPGAAPAVLIIGGAGGVGSITIQLLRALTDMTIIATTSRPETTKWVKELGAHHVVSHSDPLPVQIEDLGIGRPGFVFSTTHTGQYISKIAELIAPQGRFGLIDDPENLDIMPFKSKAVSVHWEMMFTRSMFETDDMARQGDILKEVATLLDNGKIRSTATETLGPINADNLKRAHAILESGKARGKLVLEGF